MENLELRIPEQSSDPKEVGLDPRPERVEKWLSELPLANVEQSASDLLEMLNRLNRLRLDQQHRFQLMQLTQPVVEELLKSLRGKYARALLPLPKRTRTSYDLAVQLNEATALGFKVLAQTILDRSRNKDRTSQTLLAALYMTIHHLSLHLLDCYAVYFPEAPRVWEEINQIYRFAEETGGHREHLFQHGEHTTARTIELAYKRIVLLAISNPYHLMQEEAHTVYQLLFRLAPGCHIERERLEGQDCRFVTDLKADAPPRFLAQTTSTQAIEPRYFDLSRLLAALDKRIRVLDSAEDETVRSMSRLARRMQSDMLTRLRAAWGRTRERQHERFSKLGDVNLTIGLSASHFFISNEAAFMPEIDEIRIFTGRLPGASQELSLIPQDFEPWKMEEAELRHEAGLHSPRTSNFDTEGSARDIWEKIYATKIKHDTDHQPLYSAFSWNRKNESEKGLCLLCHADCGIPVRVGEIITYLSDGRDGDAWIVGSIRWLHVNKNNSLEMGIMTMTGAATPVATRAVEGVGQGGEYFRALLLADGGLEDPDASLLTPGAIYDIGTVLALNFGDDISYVRLTGMLESTRSFSHFRYEVVGTPASETRNMEAMRSLV